MREKNTKKGFVLVVALVITLAVGLIAVSLIGLTIQEYRLSSRSSAYSKALHAAESGVALACEEFVRQIEAGGSLSGFTTNGNLTDASGTVISRYDTSAVLSGSDTDVITSTGTVSRASGTIQRIIRVTIKKLPQQTVGLFKYGAVSVGQGQIHISGSVGMDTYDPEDPTKSSSGFYDVAKAGTNATLATLSQGNPAILVDGGGNVSGIKSMSVGATGTISIAAWIPYTGTKNYNATQVVTPVVVPFSSPVGAQINLGGVTQMTITNSGSTDVSISNLIVGASGKLTFTGSGTRRIYVKGITKVDGAASIVINPTTNTVLKIEIYANGAVTVAGSGVVNNARKASNLALFGTTNCTSISVSGDSGYIGTVYAPSATLTVSGSSGAYGAFLAKQLVFTGTSYYHIDESIMRGSSSPSTTNSVKLYERKTWVEVTGS